MRYNLEKWKPVYGYEGIYEVSSLGRVRGVDRITGKNAFKKGEEKSQATSKQTGYKMVSLWKGGVGVTKTVHSMVLEAFDRPRPQGYVTRHLNGVRDDNRRENLAWGTPTENNLDKRLHGTDRQVNKTHCPRGHLLEHPNLVPVKQLKGVRECQSCCYAQSKTYREGGDFKEIADKRFQDLLRKPWIRPWKKSGTCRRGHLYVPETTYTRPDKGRECVSCMSVRAEKNELLGFLASWKVYQEVTGVGMSEEMKEAFNEFL